MGVIKLRSSPALTRPSVYLISEGLTFEGKCLIYFPYSVRLPVRSLKQKGVDMKKGINFTVSFGWSDYWTFPWPTTSFGLRTAVLPAWFHGDELLCGWQPAILRTVPRPRTRNGTLPGVKNYKAAQLGGESDLSPLGQRCQFYSDILGVWAHCWSKKNPKKPVQGNVFKKSSSVVSIRVWLGTLLETSNRARSVGTLQLFRPEWGGSDVWDRLLETTRSLGRWGRREGRQGGGLVC